MRTRDDEEKMRKIRSVNQLFKIAIDYQTYHLADTASKMRQNDVKENRHDGKAKDGSINPHTFDPFDSMSVLGFLKLLKQSAIRAVSERPRKANILFPHE